MLDAFKLGGSGMFATAICGLLLVAVALRYAVRPSPRTMPLLVSLGLVTLATGGLSFVVGLIKSCLAIDHAAPDMRWLWIVGMGEALHNVALALGLSTVAAVAASIGALRIAQSRDAPDPA
jgi:hypothetical protein